MLLKNRLLISWVAYALLAPSQVAFAFHIPFRVDQPKREFGGLIYVSAMVADKVRTVRLATGAATSRLQKGEWNERYSPIDQTEDLTASGVKDYCDLIQVPQFSLLTLNESRLDRQNYLVSRCHDEESDDLLGINFFYGDELLIDFDRKTLEIHSDPGPRKKGMQPLKTVKASYPLFAVPLSTGGDQSLYGLLDSGAEVTAVDEKFVYRNPDGFEFVRALSEDAAGPKVFRMRSLKIGGNLELNDVDVLVYDFAYVRQTLGADTPIILGFNVLSHFNWRLDLRNLNQPTWLAERRKEK